MVTNSLPERDSAFNQQSRSHNEQSFLEAIFKARALIAVVLNNGLENCSKAVQHDYLSTLDDLISHAVTAYEQTQVKSKS